MTEKRRMTVSTRLTESDYARLNRIAEREFQTRSRAAEMMLSALVGLLGPNERVPLRLALDWLKRMMKKRMAVLAIGLTLAGLPLKAAYGASKKGANNSPCNCGHVCNPKHGCGARRCLPHDRPALLGSQARGSGASQICAGFQPYYCARTDTAVAADPTFALPAVNVPFIGPDFGEREVRATNYTLLETDDPTNFTNPTSFFGGSASKYAEWGVFCPTSGGSGPTATCANPGAYRFQANNGVNGTGTLFTFNPATFQTAPGIGAPGGAYKAVPYAANPGRTPWTNGVDGGVFSNVDPDLMFGSTGQPFTTPNWIASSHFSTGVSVQPTTANGHQYIATVGGTSAATQPTWCTTSACTLTDGSITWKENGAPITTPTNAVVLAWHVMDPVTYLVADLSNCNAQASDFGSTDPFNGPYGTVGDKGFLMYGGHTTDFTGAVSNAQDAWGYQVYYNVSTNTCYWYDTETATLGSTNLSTNVRTTQGQAVDPITEASVGLVAPPAAPTLTAGTGGSLPAETVSVRVTYIENTSPPSSGTYQNTTASSSSTVTVAASGSVMVASPPSNVAGMSGTVCNTTTANCIYDHPAADHYLVYACAPTPCTETLQTATPVLLGTNTTLTSITSGAALPTVNRAGWPLHASTVDQSGSLTYGTVEVMNGIIGGSNLAGLFVNKIGTTQVVPWALGNTTYPVPSGWQPWGGHDAAGDGTVVNGNDLDVSMSLWEHTYDGASLSSFFVNPPKFFTPPACTNSYAWDACGYAIDDHPTFSGDLSNQNYPMFVDANRSGYPDGNNLEMATAGPYMREALAISPLCANATTAHCAYRFSRSMTASFGGTPPPWNASMPVAAWNFVEPVNSNGHEYVTAASCTTGATEPAWPTGAGSTVTDGSCTWREDNAASPLWRASRAFATNAFVQPNQPNGHLYVATTGGTTGTAQPTWCVTSACTLTDGTVSWKEDGTQNPNIVSGGVNGGSNNLTTAFSFYSTSIHQVSQDGKYVYGPTDWNGSLAGTSCSLYAAGTNLCGHVIAATETAPVCDVNFMDTYLDTAGDQCVPDYDLVIVELK